MSGAALPAVRPGEDPRFPSTRYLGSKARLADWIWEHLQGLAFHTCLDAFGGTGAVAYRLKQAGKAVTYNDALRFNQLIGRALIENPGVRLSETQVERLLADEPCPGAEPFIQEHFQGIYYTEEENAWLDRVSSRIRKLADPYEQAVAFFALCQAALAKRPFNLFHRRNLYLRTANVPRSFGNKASWDRPFSECFARFVAEANAAVFDNGQPNRALNYDVAEVPGEYDVVYLDPPYVPVRGAAVDYHGWYHFLEGLARFDEWAEQVDWQSRNRRLRRQASDWTQRGGITAALERVCQRYRESILVLSYRSDGVPSLAELERLLRRLKPHVELACYGRYQYVLSTNRQSAECLLVAW